MMFHFGIPNKITCLLRIRADGCRGCKSGPPPAKQTVTTVMSLILHVKWELSNCDESVGVKPNHMCEAFEKRHCPRVKKVVRFVLYLLEI